MSDSSCQVGGADDNMWAVEIGKDLIKPIEGWISIKSIPFRDFEYVRLPVDRDVPILVECSDGFIRFMCYSQQEDDYYGGIEYVWSHVGNIFKYKYSSGWGYTTSRAVEDYTFTSWAHIPTIINKK